MVWRCYAWTGINAPSEAERADPNLPVPGIHPRDWLLKPVNYEQYDDGVQAVGWYRDLMARARIDPRVDGRHDITADNIFHAQDVSAWHRLPDGRWLSWAVLRVDGAPNGQPEVRPAAM